MNEKTVLVYDHLAELKRVHVADKNAALLLDCLAERAELDGLEVEFVEWVGRVLAGKVCY